MAKIRNGYALRNFALRQIGFDCYGDYLCSELWAGIRHRALQRDHYLCLVCGAPADQVHHRSYGIKVLLGLDLGPLMSICDLHHRWAERSKGGKKRSLEAANARLDSALQARRERKASRYPSEAVETALNG